MFLRPLSSENVTILFLNSARVCVFVHFLSHDQRCLQSLATRARTRRSWTRAAARTASFSCISKRRRRRPRLLQILRVLVRRLQRRSGSWQCGCKSCSRQADQAGDRIQDYLLVVVNLCVSISFSLMRLHFYVFICLFRIDWHLPRYTRTL
jgi:hypothetical protein